MLGVLCIQISNLDVSKRDCFLYLSPFSISAWTTTVLFFGNFCKNAAHTNWLENKKETTGTSFSCGVVSKCISFISFVWLLISGTQWNKRTSAVSSTTEKYKKTIWENFVLLPCFITSLCCYCIFPWLCCICSKQKPFLIHYYCVTHIFRLAIVSILYLLSTTRVFTYLAHLCPPSHCAYVHSVPAESILHS